jgi:C4-dicarboxylate-specific signal transduction histidine kinase
VNGDRPEPSVSVEDLAERLAQLSEELGDLAFDRLREASSSVGHGVVQPALVAEEKRLTRARRAVDKAVILLRGMDGDESADG